MAAPPSIMSALDELSNVENLTIQPEGKYNELVHYTACTTKKEGENQIIFRVSASLKDEKMTIKNTCDQLMFTCHGGLHYEDDTMTVHTALNYFRGEIMAVFGLTLVDKTEVGSLLKTSLTYNAKTKSFDIKRDSEVGKSKVICEVVEHRRLSAASIDFNSNTSGYLSPVFKAFCVIACLRIIHYSYKIHLQLMPSAIPHLMPAGTTQEPLSMLSNTCKILIRPSATVGPSRASYCVLLDGATLQPLLILKFEAIRTGEVDELHCFFTDIFGNLQFAGKYDKTKLYLKVSDSKYNVIGSFDGQSCSHKLSNKEVMYSKINQYEESDGSQYSKVIQFYKKTDNEEIGNVYLMEDSQVACINMDPTQEVEQKVVIIVHSAVLSLLVLKIWAENVSPLLPEYVYREKKH